jgi:hypothetical protein
MQEKPEHIPVSMGWRLPDDRRVKVTFNTRVVAYEEDKDRWLVMLEDLAGPPSLPDLPPDDQARILALAGKWAYVPDDARKGITLPLKYETLLGRIKFFYASDPREVNSKQ